MNNKSSGIGCLGIVGIVLVILKLANLITISWWWVLAPFYGPFTVMAIIFLIMFSGGAAARALWNFHWNSKKKE